MPVMSSRYGVTLPQLQAMRDQQAHKKAARV